MSRFSTLALLSVVTLAACSKKEPATADTLPPAALPADTGAAPTISAAPDGSAGPMSDAQILTKENGGDSAEVAIGTFAQAHASDAQVKAYAAELVRDHSKGQKEVKALMTKLKLAPQLAPDDTSAQETQHTIARLGTLKGADFDTAFVKHEIEDHKTDIDDARKSAAAAKSAEVKALVRKSLPELQKHLDRAKALDKRIGAGKG